MCDGSDDVADTRSVDLRDSSECLSSPAHLFGGLQVCTRSLPEGAQRLLTIHFEEED